jgi:hypothetical protein
VVRLEPEEDALRARLDEPTWAAALASEEGGEVVAGARLAARGPVRVQVLTRAADRVVAADLGAAADGAAGAVRVSVVEADGRVVPRDGVELSLFRSARLAPEVLRLLPPDGPAPVEGATAFTIPVEAALVVSRALREQDEALARLAAATAGLDGVPPLLEALSDSLRGEATVTVVAGEQVLGTRRWLLCQLGWVHVELTPDGVLHSPVDRGGILDTLVRDVAAAWELLATPQGGAA